VLAARVIVFAAIPLREQLGDALGEGVESGPQLLPSNAADVVELDQKTRGLQLRR
jgi:hypothetical protein